MANVEWNELPQRVEVLVSDPEALDRPDAAELNEALDEFESRAGFRLPASYREYMHLFGPGALSGWFQICGPIPSRLLSEVSDVYNIDQQREMVADPEGYWATTVSEDTLRRMAIFASTEGGDWFFWDIVATSAIRPPMSTPSTGIPRTPPTARSS